jgi:hypothetical protein
MNEKNYNCKVEDVDGPTLLNVPRKRVKSDKINDFQGLYIYLYEDNKKAKEDASKISKDGYSNDRASVSWTAEPHFYIKGNIIVLYLGGDKNILSDLNDILGKQFAGNNKK